MENWVHVLKKLLIVVVCVIKQSKEGNDEDDRVSLFYFFELILQFLNAHEENTPYVGDGLRVR